MPRPLASLAASLLLFFFLFGGAGPGVTGNDTGGIIPWSPANEEIANDLAGQHCARWGKYARVTDGIRAPGHFINFICAHYYGQGFYGPPVHFWPRRR
jgi:hypothetical protein